MRICIPTADDRGIDSMIHDHFGSAPCYAMVDTETGVVEMVHNAGGRHQHGYGHRHGHGLGQGQGQGQGLGRGQGCGQGRGRGLGRGQGQGAGYGHHCRSVEHIDADSVDAVVCLGMGKRAVASLTEGGLEVWQTSATTVREALAAVQEGTLKKITTQEACGGHGNRQALGRRPAGPDPTGNPGTHGPQSPSGA